MLNRLPSYCLVLPAFLAVPLVILTSDPSRAESLGLDVWNVPNLYQSINDCSDLGKNLDTRLDDIRRRTQVKTALVRDLIASRTTLADVTDQFLQLDATCPEHELVIRHGVPGRTARERTARCVIWFATSGASDDHKAQLADRLEQEYAHLGQHATAAN